jgi:hypothetical protein
MHGLVVLDNQLPPEPNMADDDLATVEDLRAGCLPAKYLETIVRALERQAADWRSSLDPDRQADAKRADFLLEFWNTNGIPKSADDIPSIA